jgi:hypothetical protein
MTLQSTIAAHARSVQAELVARVLARVPSAGGSGSENTIRGNLLVCSSFLRTPSADTIDLCVEIANDGVAVAVSADLVRGGSGTVLSTMTTTRSVQDEAQIEVLLNAIDRYLRSQEDAIVDALLASG